VRFAEYGELCTQVYDVDKPNAPGAELAFYRAFIEAGEGPVLEPMCGSGRFLVPLAEAGVDIDGIDSSADMLAACREKLERSVLRANVYEQMLQDLDLPRRYRSAFIGGSGSFGLIPDRDEAFQSLKRINDYLEPGGRLCFEVQTPLVAQRQRLGRVGVRSWIRTDGARLVLSSTVTSFEDNVLEGFGIYELFVDGKLVETQLNELPLRLYEREEMRDVLESAGFTDIVVTKGFTDEAATDEDWLLSFRCARPL
jgi:SAM-dependent methyltransferase